PVGAASHAYPLPAHLARGRLAPGDPRPRAAYNPGRSGEVAPEGVGLARAGKARRAAARSLGKGETGSRRRMKGMPLLRHACSGRARRDACTLPTVPTAAVVPPARAARAHDVVAPDPRRRAGGAVVGALRDQGLPGRVAAGVLPARQRVRAVGPRGPAVRGPEPGAAPAREAGGPARARARRV